MVAAAVHFLSHPGLVLPLIFTALQPPRDRGKLSAIHRQPYYYAHGLPKYPRNRWKNAYY